MASSQPVSILKISFVLVSSFFLLGMLLLMRLEVGAATGEIAPDRVESLREGTLAIAAASFGLFELASVLGLVLLVTGPAVPSARCPFCRVPLEREEASSAADPSFSCPDCGHITRAKAPLAPPVAGAP